MARPGVVAILSRFGKLTDPRAGATGSASAEPPVTGSTIRKHRRSQWHTAHGGSLRRWLRILPRQLALYRFFRRAMPPRECTP